MYIPTRSKEEVVFENSYDVTKVCTIRVNKFEAKNSNDAVFYITLPCTFKMHTKLRTLFMNTKV